jgi:hypothetical protein
LGIFAFVPSVDDFTPEEQKTFTDNFLAYPKNGARLPRLYRAVIISNALSITILPRRRPSIRSSSIDDGVERTESWKRTANSTEI